MKNILMSQQIWEVKPVIRRGMIRNGTLLISLSTVFT